ncbi:MAG: hypothetical protein IKM25_01460 [Clostridia bacterium]|nr:hypothetical protein [Clostridia bacterium]
MKYMRRYFLFAVAVLSAVTVTAGIFAVNESARRVSLGETQKVIVYGNAKINEPADVTDIEPSIKKVYEYVINAKEDLIELVSLK